MYKLILLILFASVSTLFLNSCGGGGGDGPKLDSNACDTLGLNTKIINGTQCSEASSPVVRITLLSNQRNLLLCSGTMISSTHVLTAAHCFLQEEVLSAYIEVNGETIYGAQVAIHPGVSESDSAVFNDIAILRLTRGVDLPSLPLILSRETLKGNIIEIFGYGKTENELSNEEIAGNLRSGEMRVANVTPNHIFATFEGEGSNTCFGDSGGPALLTYSSDTGNVTGIVGITSSGALSNCEEGDISLFANVQNQEILDFITSVVPEVTVL